MVFDHALQFYLPWLFLVAALPLAGTSSAPRLLWTVLPYVIFLAIFMFGYTWGTNHYLKTLQEVRRLVGFASFALGVVTIAAYFGVKREVR